MKKIKIIPEIIFSAASVLISMYTLDIPDFDVGIYRGIAFTFFGFGIWKYYGQNPDTVLKDIMKELFYGSLASGRKRREK